VGKVSRSLPLGGEIITLSALDFDQGNIISYRWEIIIVLTIFYSTVAFE
jgi:hypothetical protein